MGGKDSNGFQVRSYFKRAEGASDDVIEVGKSVEFLMNPQFCYFMDYYTKSFREMLREIEDEYGWVFDFYIKFHFPSIPANNEIIGKPVVYVIKRSTGDDSLGEVEDGINPVTFERKNIPIPFPNECGSEKWKYGCAGVSLLEANFRLISGRSGTLYDTIKMLVFEPLLETLLTINEKPSMNVAKAFILYRWDGFNLSSLLDEYCSDYGITEQFNFIKTFDSLAGERRIETNIHSSNVAAFFVT